MNLSVRLSVNFKRVEKLVQLSSIKPVDGLDRNLKELLSILPTLQLPNILSLKVCGLAALTNQTKIFISNFMTG